MLLFLNLDSLGVRRETRMKVGLAGPFGKLGKAGWQRIDVALGRWLLQEMFTKNSCGLVASVLKYDSG